MPKIVSVKISDMCYETYPCQHELTFLYDDGIQNVICMIMDNETYNEYRKYLSEKDRNMWDKHFEESD